MNNNNDWPITCSCRGAEVDVKRLPKRPAPPAFGRKLTDAQKVKKAYFHASIFFIIYYYICLRDALNVFQARATHICLDCGYIYTLQKSFDEQVRFSFLCFCTVNFFAC